MMSLSITVGGTVQFGFSTTSVKRDRSTGVMRSGCPTCALACHATLSSRTKVTA